ncbi:membrane protein, putative [Pediococcus damnosus]|uniref:sulfite exporter TauE/SafE family protein n=1 Tax=Pediococcus damnosus TaxID=51663 RepID=UPI00078B4CC3|nr:sulfite exporter TauE/SafE family protein [Pediococcus damnosus]AMV69441.1 membrane protein, putative [Pediococcus damnosus]
MSLWLTFIILLVTGIAAGLLSSIAGLASLVSYPVLLLLGLPPVSANVTNTAALIFTGAGSSLSSLRELHHSRKTAWQVTTYTLMGGVVGSVLLVFAPATTFERVVPFLVFGAGVLMLWSQFRRQPPQAKTDQSSLKTVILKNIAIFLVGVYIGYFGASAGIILLSILIVTLNESFAVTNAIKNFAAFMTNILSLVIYAFTTKVYWWMVVPLGIGMFIGGYTGPVVVRHVPVKPLRTIIAFAAFGLAGYLFYTAYF